VGKLPQISSEEKMTLFHKIDLHLCGDIKPSAYVQALNTPAFMREYPFTMLSCLKTVGQSPQHHPEGSVWNHTMLVLDEAALRKEQATDVRVFMWAALLHDMGKAKTTRTRNGKITAYDHDKVGAALARDFLMEFAPPEFIFRVSSLVRWHMQILYVTKSMRFADLDAMRQETDLHDVALLGLCDRLGRGNARRSVEERTVSEFLRQAGL